ncbi:hypothetical protein DRQ33_02325 [bacterium]|nr:MAG: hypothetical protein DRQ33_02325 [bacterium]
MRKYLIYIGLIVLAVGLVIGDEFRWSAKNTAMADCGFSLPLDAGSVFYNPAFAGAYGKGILSIGYGLPLSGIESKAKSGYFSYVRPLNWNTGIAVLGNIENISSYQILRLGGDFAYRIAIAGTLSLGAGVNWIQRSYELPPDDPLSGRNPSALSFDLGMLWQPNDRLALGISAMDINEPSLAIQEDAPSSELPIRFSAGLSYRIIQFFIPEIAITHRSFVVGEKSNPEYRIGFYGGLPSNVLFWRGGITPEVFNLGVGWHISAIFGGMDIDYAFGLPTESSLRNAGVTQHYFGITIYGRQSRIRKGDLEMVDMNITGKFKSEQEIEITGLVCNKGNIFHRGISCALAIYDTQKWKVIYPTNYIDTLAPNQYTEIKWVWKPRKEGNYVIRLAVDDDGSAIPDISGSIDEKNEKNNVLIKEIIIGTADTIILEPKTSILNATQLIIKVEEEPVVPVVFFPPGSDNIDEYGKQILNIISRRLANNPDAILTIYGYYDDSDGDIQPEVIATRRAEAVKNYMIANEPILDDRVFISGSHDMEKTRLSSKYSKDDPRVSQENRRVEFSVGIKNVDTLSLGKNDAIQLMKNNEELLLVIIGERTKSEPAGSGIARANSIKQELINRNAELEKRIIAEEEIGEKGNIRYKIDPDGIIVRPRERYPVSEQWKQPEPPQNVIYIDRIGYENVNHWQINIESEDGKLVHTIAEGSGSLPDSIVWDWSVGENRFLAPNNSYALTISLETAETKREYRSSQKIRVVPRQKIEAIENMLLVEFNFDETEPVSHYLERRLFNFAETFVARADSGYIQTAEVQGHTDNIGSERRNMELSRQRAEREFHIMRKFIAYFAGVHINQLDNWLKEHNCSLSYKGYAWEQPYILRGKLIGDNDTPYGRSINRRVTLEYFYEKSIGN